jgi:hypothetical protein
MITRLLESMFWYTNLDTVILMILTEIRMLAYVSCKVLVW